MSVLVPPLVQDALRPYVDAGVLGVGDVHFAEWVLRASGTTEPLLALGAAFASWAAQRGHACVNLDTLAEVVAIESADRSGGRDDTVANVGSDVALALPWPLLDEWLTALRGGAVDGLDGTAGAGGPVRLVTTWDTHDVLDRSPLVLRGHSLYLQRYWVDECKVSSRLRGQATATGETLSTPARELLDRLLPAADHGAPNQQRLAAECVVANRLALIAGGPGTGKTYSVARLLAVLIADAQADTEISALRIALAAPTGKAAARLHETINNALSPHADEEPIAGAVSEALRAITPTTIHRLLGPLGRTRQRFRHDAAHPLPHDVVVIDETSMVSLPLLARLVDAVRHDARLVLIGDPDQLESVELGAVLGDLVKAAATQGSSPLAGRLVKLLRVHRFEEDSPIALLADAVRDQDPDRAMARLALGAAAGSGHSTKGSSVGFIETDDPRSTEAVAAIEAIIKPLLLAARAAGEAGRAEEALAASLVGRILCAHRLGPWGVAEWNRRGEWWLRGRDAPPAAWYPGRPLLITRNDPRLGLANGDTGVVIKRDRGLVAVFRSADALHPLEFESAQLEDVETAYAMTVHKSQGSEYSSVVLVLPPERSPLVGRELVYTGITRARDHLLVVGSEASLRRAVLTPARRMSGLADSLLVTPTLGLLAARTRP